MKIDTQMFVGVFVGIGSVLLTDSIKHAVGLSILVFVCLLVLQSNSDS